MLCFLLLFGFSVSHSLVSSNWLQYGGQTGRLCRLQGAQVATRRNDSSLTLESLFKPHTCILLKKSLSHRLSFLMMPFRTSAFFRLAANSSTQRFREVSAWLKICSRESRAGRVSLGRVWGPQLRPSTQCTACCQITALSATNSTAHL